MKLIYALLALLSIPALAASPAGVPSVTVSAPGANTGQVTISPSQLSGTGTNGIFSLFASVGSTTQNDYYPLYKNGVAYQVGSGVKAYCFDITASSGVASSVFQLVSATASFSQGAPSITGGVYQGGAASTYPSVTGSTANVQAVVPGVYVFGSSSYPGIQYGSGTATLFTAHMDCYEQ